VGTSALRAWVSSRRRASRGLIARARPRSATGPRPRRGTGRSPWCGADLDERPLEQIRAPGPLAVSEREPEMRDELSAFLGRARRERTGQPVERRNGTSGRRRSPRPQGRWRSSDRPSGRRPSSGSSANFPGQVDYLVEALGRAPPRGAGVACRQDGTTLSVDRTMAVATDPPHCANAPYGDLSDFFYVWLRRCLAEIDPELFRTVLVPKTSEPIAEPARQGSWESAPGSSRTGSGGRLATSTPSTAPPIPLPGCDGAGRLSAA
jgi:hypothetical protein